MALINDSRLYSGGTALLDQRPHTALYAQLEQRKQARDAAFDDYIRNLNKGVNSAGVRNIDRPVFDQKLKEWQKFGIEKRDAIRNRQGGADIEFMNKYQDLQNIIGASKTEEEKKKPAVEILLDPAKRDRLNNDEFVKAIHDHDQPLYILGPNGELELNPNRKSLDYSGVVFNPKPFDQAGYFKQFEGVKRMDLPPVITTDPKTMMQTQTTTSVFDQPAKDLVAQKAVTEYMQNPSFKSIIDKLDDSEYNDFYKENFGSNIDSKADLAAAYTLKGLQQKTIDTKVSPDVLGRELKMQAIRQANAKELLYLRKALKTDEDAQANDLWIDNYVDKVSQEAKAAGNKMEVRLANGQKINGYKISLDPTMSKAIGIDSKNPGSLIVTEDGEFVPLYFETDANFNPLKKNGAYSLVSERTNKISPEQIKLALGKTSGVKQMNREMSAGSQATPKVESDAYSRQELKSAGWTDDQINKAVKAGKIKIK